MQFKTKDNIVVGVLGSGSFATAIVKILVENCPIVHWCVRDENVKKSIEKNAHNPEYLTSVSFDVSQLRVMVDVNAFFELCDMVFLVTPSIYLAQQLKSLNVNISEKFIISAIKGIIPEQNDIVAHYLRDHYNVAIRNQAVISGPCHAEEVAMERLSYLTISACNKDKLSLLNQCLESEFIKTTPSFDIIGNEYSSVLKNIYAVGAGIAAGLGYGDNFHAVFVSNAIREIEKYLNAISPKERSVNNSSILGDLLVTCYSLFSRNRNLGNLIGKGYTVKSAIENMNMVAEGYYATRCIHQIAGRNHLDLPIIKTVYGILFEQKSAEIEFEKLTTMLN